MLGQDLRASGLLKDTFRLLTPNLPAVGVVAAISLLMQLLEQYLIVPPVNTQVEWAANLSWLRVPFSLLDLLVRLAVTAGFIRFVAAGLLDERHRAAGPALKAILVDAIRLGLMWLLLLFMVVAGAVLFVIPGVYLAVSLSLAPAALVIDVRNPVTALSRSYSIVKGHRWRLLLVGAALLVVHLFMVVMSKAVLMAVARLTPLGLLPFTVVDVVVSTTGGCLLQIAIVLAYLRITRRPPPAARPVPVPASPVGA